MRYLGDISGRANTSGAGANGGAGIG